MYLLIKKNGEKNMDDNKNAKTEWLGLQNNREGVYSGQIIKKADIPPYSRLIVLFNSDTEVY